jgi:hypothetical protein
MALNVGVTSHRAGVLTASLVRTLRPVVYTVFRQLRDATLQIQVAEAAFCSLTPARLLLHTPLATGTDQIAAICARSSGYFIRALLPLSRANTAMTLHSAKRSMGSSRLWQRPTRSSRFR